MTTIGDATEVTYTAPDSTIPRTVYDKLAESISVKDFDAKGDGTTDDSDAIIAAIEAASIDPTPPATTPNTFNRVVHFPCGKYKVTKPITITQGILLKGEGSQGSNQNKGTVILYDDSTAGRDLFTFDGTGGALTAAYGTGGGLENLTIMVATNRAAGVAVRILATDCTKRAGEMMITNVFITAQSQDASSTHWSQGLVVDGDNCVDTTSGGVRTISARKLRITNCYTEDKSIEFISARHIFIDGLEVDPGSTTRTHGITFSGKNDGIFINSAEVYGNIIIEANDGNDAFTRNFHMTAKVNTSFQCLDDDVEGTVRLSGLGTTGTELVNYSPRLKIMSYAVPRVLATMSSTQTNVTGNGATGTVLFNSAPVNRFSNYHPSGTYIGQFICTIAGLYAVRYNYLMTKVTTSHTRLDASIRHSRSSDGTFPKNYTKVFNPGYMAVPAVPPSSPNGYVAVSNSMTLELKYGDVIQLQVAVNGGGADDLGIYGGSGTQYTWMEIDYLS